MLLLGKRAFKRYPTSSAQKSHALRISHVRNPRHRSHLQAPLPGPSPSLAPRQIPALLCTRAAAGERSAGGCFAASWSGRLQPSAGVSGAGGYKAQGRAHQLINRLSTGFSGLWIKPLTNFFQLFMFLSSHSPSVASTFSIDLIHLHFFIK